MARDLAVQVKKSPTAGLSAGLLKAGPAGDVRVDCNLELVGVFVSTSCLSCSIDYLLSESSEVCFRISLQSSRGPAPASELESDSSQQAQASRPGATAERAASAIFVTMAVPPPPPSLLILLPPPPRPPPLVSGHPVALHRSLGIAYYSTIHVEV